MSNNESAKKDNRICVNLHRERVRQVRAKRDKWMHFAILNEVAFTMEY